MGVEKGVWRWNVNDTWQSFSSMYQEAFLANQATSDFERYHHLSACLLFGGCAIESFLNESMRKKLESDNADEKAIFDKIRYTSIKKKLEEWPTIICDALIDDAVQEVILNYLNLRNEVTHRKRKDHSLYAELDQASPAIVVEAVQKAYLSLFAARKEAFPYWLLGWNYVGFNGDKTHPCLLNNQQLLHSLRIMGFKVPSFDYGAAQAWEKQHMTSAEGFEFIKRDIFLQAPEIEPRQEMFPLAPKLCKRWWDKEFIKAN